MNAELEGLLAFMPDASVVVDADGRIVGANQKALDLFGYTTDEALGQPVEVLVPERFRDLHRAQRATYIGAPRARPMGAGLELFGRRKDGSEFPMDASLAPIVSGEQRLVIGAVRDITTRTLGFERMIDQVAALTPAVAALAERVEVADDLDQRQRRQDRHGRRLLWVLVADLLFTALTGMLFWQVHQTDRHFSRTQARAQCESLNAANATNAQFWRDLIDKFPAVPPGLDATQSEKDAYAAGQARTARFQVEIDKLGAPKPC